LENESSGRKALVEWVASATQRLSAAALIQQVARQLGCRPGPIRRQLRELVEAGQLAYCTDGNGSYVDIALDRCLPIGRRLVLCPAHGVSSPEQIAVRLHRGAAFGCGRHPTTRLALRAIETVFENVAWASGALQVLDIGTGTGVLAIAALGLGAAHAMAIDIDPVALAEARTNLVLNGLAEKARVEATPLERLAGPYDLIIANLRYPTLCRLASLVGRLAAPSGRIVLSGFRPDEARDIVDTYAAQAMQCFWQQVEKDWMALALVKGDG